MRLRTQGRRVPAANEVLVRVHASSLNDYDLFILGRPPLPFV
jgi:NADPH:quinone reductase-like Zn-dependent oxidoreductase